MIAGMLQLLLLGLAALGSSIRPCRMEDSSPASAPWVLYEKTEEEKRTKLRP